MSDKCKLEPVLQAFRVNLGRSYWDRRSTQTIDETEKPLTYRPQTRIHLTLYTLATLQPNTNPRSFNVRQAPLSTPKPRLSPPRLLAPAQALAAGAPFHRKIGNVPWGP